MDEWLATTAHACRVSQSLMHWTRMTACHISSAIYWTWYEKIPVWQKAWISQRSVIETYTVCTSRSKTTEIVTINKKYQQQSDLCFPPLKSARHVSQSNSLLLMCLELTSLIKSLAIPIVKNSQQDQHAFWKKKLVYRLWLYKSYLCFDFMAREYTPTSRPLRRKLSLPASDASKAALRPSHPSWWR